MKHALSSSSRLIRVLRSKEALVLLACAAAAMITQWTTGPMTSVGGVALHAGIALAVFWAGNRQKAWCVFAGVLVSNAALAASASHWQPLMAADAVVIALTVVLQGWSAAACLRRVLRDSSPLDTTRSVLLFLACGALGSSLFPAALLPLWLLAHRLLAPAEMLEQAIHVWLNAATGVVLGAPLLLVFLDPSEVSRNRRVRLGLPLAVGIAVVMLGFKHTSALERQAEQAAFREDAAALTHALEQELAYVLSAPDALAQLWIASEHISREQFQRAAEHMGRRHPAIVKLAWLPRATAAGSEYYPLFDLDLPDRNQLVLGHDAASDSERAATLQQAVSTRRLSVSPSVPLFDGDVIRPAIMAFVPTLDAVPQLQPRGVILCVVRLDELLRMAVQHAGHDGVALRLQDALPGGELAPLASFGTRSVAGEPDSPYVLTKRLGAGDRTWLLTAWRTKQQVALRSAWQEDVRLLRGLLFAGVLSGFLLLVTGRMARIEAAVVARTAELAGINKYLISEINTRWEAQRALAASDARWQFALEGADTGVLDWDILDQRAFYSAKWKQLLGYAPDAEGPSMEGWAELVHPDDVALCRTQLAHLLSGASQMFQLEHRMRRQDGVTIWTATRGTVVLRDLNGRALRIIATQSDVSARKENERELVQHRDHLDELVRLRTHDLEQARALAQRADEAKSRFLRNMSHELKTPLHGILGYAQLGGELQDECSQAYFSRIVASAQQLERLVGNVLELSSLELDERPLFASIIDIEALIRDVAGELREMLLERNQVVTFVVPAEVASTTLQGNVMRLRSLYRHLLMNASRYSPTGTKITVSFGQCRATDASRLDMLEVSIIDQGVGIASGETESIFQSFEQGSRTRSNAGGTGIGLAICRAIVLQHGGSICAQSNEGVGATFTVRLPAPSLRPLSCAS